MLNSERCRNLYTRDGMLNPELVRVLKIPNWEYHTAEYLYELRLKVDHRLVRSVLEMDFELDIKIQFFKWTGATTKMFQHDSSSYMVLIRCLEEAKLYSEIHTTIQDVLNNTFVRFSLPQLSELSL
ncbi:Pentatricopeptide repeat-containing protein [Cardamine amara subsp. amara]|uniref:Pentatricopeptide repeat-containing protein n=1 Tax=Cardamine amara subsp. amara TaxID=228776 RepID=A0ABD1AH30_CARAN